MKLIIGNTPITNFNLHTDTDDATMVSSDMQSGVIAYAKHRKIVGTGKAFSFASYGGGETNLPYFVPNVINTIQISSTTHPVKMTIPLNQMIYYDFTTEQPIAEITIDGTTYPMSVTVQDNFLTVNCEQTINIQLFYGKDEYA